MSEKLYALLLKLYPDHFRRAYGDDALRLVRDRARAEKGFLSGFRLWLDLLADLAISLPREYGNAPAKAALATQSLNGEPSFQLLAERPLSPALLCVGGTLSAVLFYACVTAVAHNRTFPAWFRDTLSLQWLVQGDIALSRSHPKESGIGSSAHSAQIVAPGAYSFCMTANRDIPINSVQPLFTFDFSPPGASGVALIDGEIVKRFTNEQDLSIRADLFAGEHQFGLQLDTPAENTSMSNNANLKYCQPK
jgi:hypothetical protein